MNNSTFPEILNADVLIIGCGMAGLSAAYQALSQQKRVIIVSKNDECASNYVLGFNTPISNQDSTELFFDDTFKGGVNISNKALVKKLAEGSLEAVEWLNNLGFEFDKEDGNYNLLKPLGCSCPRLIHIGNLTGKTTVERFTQLVKDLGATILNNSMAFRLLVENKTVYGAEVVNIKNGKFSLIKSKSVVLATGGIHISKDSTYPKFMTGDGYALAYNAGAELIDMEFIQFEPCRCIYPKKLGISTTLLAKGGQIKNNKGERFLLEYFENEGVVSKDMLARFIALEVKKGNGSKHGGVYLDLTMLDPKEIIENHSLYYNRFKNIGVDLTKDIIEVGPSAHSFMGGVVIDENAKTTINGLFAAGEVAGGIHGANRVGGNAGSEIYVFGKIAGNSASLYCDNEFQANSSYENSEQRNLNFSDGNTSFEDYKAIENSIHELMHKYMGPARDYEALHQAECSLNDILVKLKECKPTNIEALVSGYEVSNLALVCSLSVKSAIERKESRGVHYRTDYPYTKEEFLKNICVSVYD